MAQGMGPGRTMRSFLQDDAVRAHALAPGTVRRILRFAAPHRGKLAVFLVLLAIDAVIGAALPLLYRAVIDDGIAHHDEPAVTAIAIAIAALAMGSAIGTLVQRWLASRIGEALVHDLRTALFDHVQRLPVAFFSRARTGALIQRLNGDVQGAQQAFTSTLSNVVGNLFTIVFTLAAMLAMSWRITLLALALLPLFLIPARVLSPRLRRVTAERYRLDAELAHTMTEQFNVAGATLAKIYGRPDDQTAAFGAQSAQVRDVAVAQAVYAAIFRVSLTLVAALAAALVYGLGGVLAVRGELGVGTLVALTAYLARLYGPLTAMSNVQVDVMTTLVSFERVFEVLDLPPMVADAPGALALPASAPASIELEHVSFRYPAAAEVSLASLEAVATLSADRGVDVLHDVSFRVEPGRMVALVGPSGSGKSTITALVTRLHDATAGTVRVGGLDVRAVTQASLRARIGVVTQDAHMFHATIRANLALARPGVSDAEILDALAAAQLGPLVGSLPDGLDTLVGERGYRLSGGERQRLAIARLLIKSPSIVILDEATAHLDSESEAAIQDALAAALRGRTSLVVAHRLSTVRNADEILVLDEGRLVQRGTHAELLAAGGVYAELYRTQFAEQER